MKKPVILVVDDDQAVLAALETTLGVALGEVARVEIFADPLEALHTIESREEDDRPVAVTVADQKMPGMSGSDLLCRLREIPRCEHMRSILLTGYGGLESALDAKNHAGVARYREKPWRTSDLLDDVRSQFAVFMEASEMDRHAVLREVRESAEVAKHLRLRHSVYREHSHLTKLTPDTEAGMDVDEYDRISHLIGLFVRSGRSERLVGTHRYVVSETGPAADALEDLTANHPDLRESAGRPIGEPFPCMNYVATREPIGRLIERWVSAGERVSEASRFTLDPRFRAHSGSRRLAFHVIEGAMAFFHVLGIENVITFVVADHKALYEAYGMVVAEGTEVCFYPELDVDACVLHGRHSWLPPRVSSRVNSLVRRIERTGAACQCPAQKKCLKGPYESGDFRTVDLLCPLRAWELTVAEGCTPPGPLNYEQDEESKS